MDRNRGSTLIRDLKRVIENPVSRPGGKDAQKVTFKEGYRFSSNTGRGNPAAEGRWIDIRWLCVTVSGGGNLNLDIAPHCSERLLHLAHVGAVVRVRQLRHG